jgi:predicted DNA-binding WGR domain protein
MGGVAGNDGGATPEGVPFAHAVRFVSFDPEKDRARFYELRFQETLWGGAALVRARGRLGTPGRWRASEFPERAAAGADGAPGPPRQAARAA